jgi:hypothetical protein
MRIAATVEARSSARAMMRKERYLVVLISVLLLARPAGAADQAPQVAVIYPAGWNLVAGPVGMDFSAAASPLYTLQAGDSAYEAVPPGPVQRVSAGTPSGPHVGSGYWAYFDRQTTIAVPTAYPMRRADGVPGSAVYLIKAPAGQWIMIGNPYSLPVTITGADALVRYDPAHGLAGDRALPLPPGQGEFAYSGAGAALAICPIGQACQ